MDKQRGPGELLIETLRNAEFQDIVKESSELLLDSFLQDGPVKDIPIIGWIIGVGKTAIAVRDRFLVRKVLRFLEGLSGVGDNERQQFSAKLEEDEKLGRHVGETLIVLLDRFDDTEKAAFLSKLFRSYVAQEIGFDEFRRMASSIERAYLADLRVLLSYASGKIEDTPEVRQTKRKLYSCDFSDFYVLTAEQARESGLEYPQVYHFNRSARNFAKIILGSQYHDDRW